jgi:hypothetical protein
LDVSAALDLAAKMGSGRKASGGGCSMGWGILAFSFLASGLLFRFKIRGLKGKK